MPFGPSNGLHHAYHAEVVYLTTPVYCVRGIRILYIAQLGFSSVETLERIGVVNVSRAFLLQLQHHSVIRVTSGRITGAVKV